MNQSSRRLRSVLEEIVEEDGSAAAPTPSRAQAEIASLASRIRRRRAVNGAVAATSAVAVAAAGVIGVLTVVGVGSPPDTGPAAGPRPVATASPDPAQPSPPLPTPSPTAGSEPATTPAPSPQSPAPPQSSPVAAPPVAESPAPSADDPEVMARAVFAEYLDAWRRGDSETLRRLSDVTNSDWAGPLEYRPVIPEMSCTFLDDDTFPRLDCDVDLVGSFHFVMRVSIEPAADGRWLAKAAEMGVG